MLSYCLVQPIRGQYYKHVTADPEAIFEKLLLVLVNYIPYKYYNLVWLLACFKLYRLQLIQQ